MLLKWWNSYLNLYSPNKPCINYYIWATEQSREGNNAKHTTMLRKSTYQGVRAISKSCVSLLRKANPQDSLSAHARVTQPITLKILLTDFTCRFSQNYFKLVSGALKFLSFSL